jgi:hypothetical protein
MPVKEINIEFKTLDNWQRNVYDNRKRFTVVAAGRRMGKSTLSTKIVVERFLGIHDQMNGRKMGKRILVCHPNTTFQPPWWKALHDLLDPLGDIIKWNETNKTVEYGDALIKLHSLEAGTALRGSEWDLLVCDEVAFCPDFTDLWNGVISQTLMSSHLTSGHLSEALFISTYNGTTGNWFYDSYMLGQSGEDPEWTSFRYDIYQSTLYTPKEIENMKKNCRSEAFWQQEFMANPEVSNSPFGTHIFKNVSELSTKPPIAFGIDVASTYDFTSITALDEDYRVCYHKVLQPGDWNVVIDTIKQLPRNVGLTLDSTGAGKIVYDIIKGTHKVRPFHFSQNSKIELIERLIKTVEEGGIFYPRQIAEQMTVFEGKRLPSGKYEYKARGNNKDDQVISLALALEGRNTAGRQGTYFTINI